jgi:hypothetical protein
MEEKSVWAYADAEQREIRVSILELIQSGWATIVDEIEILG